jgi:hypothetical protein
MQYLIIALAFTTGFLLIFGVNLLIADVLEAQRQQGEVRETGR